MRDEIAKIRVPESKREEFIRLWKSLYIPFELRANESYSTQNQVQNILMDMDTSYYSRKLLRASEKHEAMFFEILRRFERAGFEDLLKYLQNKTQSYQSLTSSVVQAYLELENTWLMERRILRRAFFGYIGRRDKRWSKTIRYLANSQEVIAFPVGLRHIMCSKLGLTLYSRIQDLNPQRLYVE